MNDLLAVHEPVRFTVRLIFFFFFDIGCYYQKNDYLADFLC